MIESGFSWAPSLGWRMDKQWQRMRKETPHLTRPPSEYLREHFWFCTQPMEEPEDPSHLYDVLDWIGWDRLMFSSDYPALGLRRSSGRAELQDDRRAACRHYAR